MFIILTTGKCNDLVSKSYVYALYKFDSSISLDVSF